MVKAWVVQFGGPDRCTDCGVRGIDALRAEQETARLPQARIYRHPECNHILFYRGGGSTPTISREDVQRRIDYLNASNL